MGTTGKGRSTGNPFERGDVRALMPPRFRLVVLGLDSVPPDLLYRRFAPVMPHFAELLAGSAKGTLRSCDPPITVPAWAVMFSGVDPGTLGLYGFRHRRPGSYLEMYLPTSGTPRHPMVWQTLSRLGYRVAVLGMPPGYPPPVVNGVAVSDFLTPDGATDPVAPPRYRELVERAAGGPFFDVPFRVNDRHHVADEIYEMTRRRWRVARELWRTEPWDLFVVHDIGPDRVHHAFWKYFDRDHPRYEPGSEFSEVVSGFYALLDQEIGTFLEEVGPEVAVLLVSDHGSQAMQGCFCVNDWLLQQGLLVLKDPVPPPGTPLEKIAVDWPQTKVWAAGGYYARFFLNLAGREPAGVLRPSEVPLLVDRLREGLEGVRTPDGRPMGVRLFAPIDAYREVQGDAPDLMAYFGDARWRSAGTIGHRSLFLEENDTGPDDAVHSFDGVIAWKEPGGRVNGDLPEQRIVDVAPTILARFGVEIPATMQGRPIRELL